MTEPSDAVLGFAVLLDQGLAWVDRLKSGEMTVDEGETLQRWCQRSARHQQAFAEAVAVSQAVREASAGLPRVRLPSRDVARDRGSAPLFTRRAFIGGAVTASTATAAGVLAYAALGPWPALDEIVGVLDADYKTATGERRMLTVARVTVELSTQSSLALLPTRAANGVRLIHGEAAIETDGVPFVVQAGAAQLRAERARLNVRLERHAACVTCIAGVLEVRHPHRSVTLQPGEQLFYSDREVGAVERANAEIATAWRRGMLIFHDAPLSRVIAEINRYRKGQIVLLDAALGTRSVYATVHLDRIDAAVEQLGKFTGAQVWRVGQMVFMR